jgi:hypothetical protein
VIQLKAVTPSDQDPNWSKARCVTTTSSRETQHAVGRDHDAGATFRIFDGTFLIRREDINIFLEVVFALKLPSKNERFNGNPWKIWGGEHHLKNYINDYNIL